MNNELFRKLHENDPKLAKLIEQSPEAMRKLNMLDEERAAVEAGQYIESQFPGVSLEIIGE